MNDLNILNDQREILELSAENGDSYAHVGKNGITKIVVYGQGAMHCDIPWFAVYQGDVIIKRLNAHFVCEVYYKP